jgi:hypothetical protein
VVFGEGDFVDSSNTWFLEWVQEGFLADLLPRACLERLKLESWEMVGRYLDRLERKPSWWNDPEERQIVERWYKARLREISGSS